MQAHERELREVVLKPWHVRPVALLVAIAADRERPTMRVVGRVTPSAIYRQRVREPAHMASRAGETTMRPLERMTRLRSMIEVHPPPALLVTGTAVGAVAAEMSVVPGMAPLAIRGKRFELPLANVAVPARKRCVRRYERESGLALMVEFRLPGRGAMTPAAAVAARPAVGVVEPMTVDARRSDRFESRVRVTGETREARVSTGQREPGGVVVEGASPPSGGLVAVAAGATEATAVHVVVTMAGCAIRRRVGKPLIGSVATGARRFGVRSQQRKIGQRVVEQIRLQTHDVRIATLVLGVALAALRAACLGMFGMKALIERQILRDRLVTIQT